MGVAKVYDFLSSCQDTMLSLTDIVKDPLTLTQTNTDNLNSFHSKW